MPKIAGELETCTEDTTECADLVDFSCGDGRRPAEATVERIVAAFHGNRRSDITLRVTRELPSNSLVGLVIIEWNGLVFEHPTFPTDAYEDAAYIAVITLSAQYRGGYTSQEGRPLSEVLLTDALRYIASERGGEIPPVQAIIEPQNTPSRELVERHGFEQPIETEPDLLYIRPRGLAIEGGTIEGDEEAEK